MYNKFISILIPHYNEDDFLVSRLLDSIRLHLNEFYNTIEVLICDDGLDCIDISKSLENRPYEVKHIKKEHKTVSAARNRLLDNCNGKYIIFCDADDGFIDNGFEKLFCYLWNNKNRDIYKVESMISKIDLESNRNDCYIRSVVHGKVFNHDIIKKNNIRWNDDLRFHEDSYFSNLYNKHIDNSKIVFFNESFYGWYDRLDRVTRSIGGNCIDFCINTYTDFIKSCALSSDNHLKFSDIDYAYKFVYSHYFDNQEYDSLKNDIIDTISRYINENSFIIDDKASCANSRSLLNNFQINNDEQTISFNDFKNKIMSKI